MKLIAVQRVVFVSLFVVVTAISGIAVAAFTISSNSSSLSAQESKFVVVELHENYITPDSVALKIGQEIQIVNRSDEPRELFLGAGDAHVNHDNDHDSKDSDNHKNDNHNHSHEHDHEGGFSTNLIGTDEAWQGSFSEAGTYFLHDHEKANINLLIVVYE